MRPDEVSEEEGDREDDQEDLGEHEDDHADPEADADFLFQREVFHQGETLSRSGGRGPPREAGGEGPALDGGADIPNFLEYGVVFRPKMPADMATVSDKGVDLRSK